MGVSSEPGGLRIGPLVSPSTQTLTPLRFRVGAFDATFRDLRVHFSVSKILGLVPTTKNLKPCPRDVRPSEDCSTVQF